MNDSWGQVIIKQLPDFCVHFEANHAPLCYNQALNSVGGVCCARHKKERARRWATAKGNRNWTKERDRKMRNQLCAGFKDWSLCALWNINMLNCNSQRVLFSHSGTRAVRRSFLISYTLTFIAWRERRGAGVPTFGKVKKWSFLHFDSRGGEGIVWVACHGRRTEDARCQGLELLLCIVWLNFRIVSKLDYGVDCIAVLSKGAHSNSFARGVM